jgi:hypothetical protein
MIALFLRGGEGDEEQVNEETSREHIPEHHGSSLSLLNPTIVAESKTAPKQSPTGKGQRSLSYRTFCQRIRLRLFCCCMLHERRKKVKREKYF